MDTARQRGKLYLTFAGGDLPLVRPVAAALRQGGGALALDYAVMSESFAAQRSELLRASLELRIKRCAATVCLFGTETLDDSWVRWTLATAQTLRLPLIGAPLAAGAGEVGERLAGMGVEIVPLEPRALAERPVVTPRTSYAEALSAEVIAHTFRLMRHPLG